MQLDHLRLLRLVLQKETATTAAAANYVGTFTFAFPRLGSNSDERVYHHDHHD